MHTSKFITPSGSGKKNTTPKIIVLASGLPGCGRTILAVELGIAARHAGQRAGVIDLDPQHIAMTWLENYPGNAPDIVTSFRPDFTADGYDFIFIDTGM